MEALERKIEMFVLGGSIGGVLSECLLLWLSRSMAKPERDNANDEDCQWSRE